MRPPLGLNKGGLYREVVSLGSVISMCFLNGNLESEAHISKGVIALQISKYAYSLHCSVIAQSITGHLEF